MNIYIDNDNKCHLSDDGAMRGFDVPFFDNKCPTFVEGHYYVPPNEVRKGEDGTLYQGEQITPWRDLALLEEFQKQYEAMIAEANAAYESGVNSI